MVKAVDLLKNRKKMQYEVTVKLKHRLNKSKEEWGETFSRGFDIVEKADIWKLEQKIKYAKYPGKHQITDNYSK